MKLTTMAWACIVVALRQGAARRPPRAMMATLRVAWTRTTMQFATCACVGCALQGWEGTMMRMRADRSSVWSQAPALAAQLPPSWRCVQSQKKPAPAVRAVRPPLVPAAPAAPRVATMSLRWAARRKLADDHDGYGAAFVRCGVVVCGHCQAHTRKCECVCVCEQATSGWKKETTTRSSTRRYDCIGCMCCEGCVWWREL